MNKDIVEVIQNKILRNKPLVLKEYQIYISWKLSEYYLQFFPKWLKENHKISSKTALHLNTWKLLDKDSEPQWREKSEKKTKEILAEFGRPTIEWTGRNIVYTL